MNREQIQFLIDNLQEGLEVEVKNWLGGLNENDAKAKLAKEIIALANSGGGFIFIGFDDNEAGHPEIEPAEGELDAFSQDKIAALVQKYVEPPCQCQIGYFSRTGSQIRHPVIVVPGNHRTPLWARSGSPDGVVRPGTVYVRRPGGSSEPARTQDDWEKLIERLVKARQDDQLAAIRRIFNPLENVDLTAKPNLEKWDEECYQEWQTKINELPENSPHRLAAGHWSFAFIIEPFNAPSLNELNQALEREMPTYSGWPPFTYLHAAPMRPIARGDNIEAWLYNPHRDDPSKSDYWRVARQGRGFLLRPMQEDEPDFMQTRVPGPQRPAFDWILPIYRTTELLKFVEALGHRFADGNSQASILLRYYRCEGRTLCCHDFRLHLLEGARCFNPVISSQMSIPIEEIGINLEERVHALLAPVFEQFEFSNLPKAIVDRVVRDALNYAGN